MGSRFARSVSRAIALVVALEAATAGIVAADEVDDALSQAGQAAYDRYCTPCHGAGGTPGTAMRDGKPVDLRTYVAAHGGRFPAGRWLNAITNPNPGRTHTPVWERILRDQSGPGTTKRAAARGVVAQIARYIDSVQVAEKK